jgi:GTP cyclohydrolase I
MSLLQDLHPMPDVALEQRANESTSLNWVGMSEIKTRFFLVDADEGKQLCHGQAHCYVSLDNTESKGIHMSRLYHLLCTHSQEHAMTPLQTQQLLKKMVESHTTISKHAKIIFEFDFFQKQKSLKSQLVGSRAYPIKLVHAVISDQPILQIELTVPYASTCPCSGALSKQLIEQSMQRKFADTDVINKKKISAWMLDENTHFASPHGQRSFAHIKLRTQPDQQHYFLSHLIRLTEMALKTPVQSAVKREDEQEFARLCGTHPMFCEDAARTLKTILQSEPNISDFYVRVEHQESLHAHNAVAVATKGVSSVFNAECNTAL